MITYYLMIKTHNVTGLKYLCQSKQNPESYKGSGLDWKKHIKKYGNDISTEILLITKSITERNYWGRHYSKLLNVVNGVDDFGNKIWANRIPETGGGPGVESSANSRYQKEIWVNSAHRENMIAMRTLIWSDPVRRTRQQIISKESQNRPEVKAKHSKNSTLLWTDPVFKKDRIVELKHRWQDPIFVERMKSVQKEVQNKPETIDRKRQKMKDLQTPEHRQKNRESQNRPEVVKKKSDSLKKLWSQAEFKESALINSALTKPKFGDKNPNYDNTMHQFTHKTGLTEYCTKFELQIKYKLSQSHLSMLVSGKVKTCKGWKLDIK